MGRKCKQPLIAIPSTAELTEKSAGVMRAIEETLASKLKLMRLERNISLPVFAEATDVEIETVQKWESTKRSTLKRITFLAKVAEMYGYELVIDLVPKS